MARKARPHKKAKSSRRRARGHRKARGLKRMKLTRREQKWISKKIKFLVRYERKTQKQAAGQAYGMLRQRRRKHRKG